jgi:hypothetical protein
MVLPIDADGVAFGVIIFHRDLRLKAHSTALPADDDPWFSVYIPGCYSAAAFPTPQRMTTAHGYRIYARVGGMRAKENECPPVRSNGTPGRPPL